MTNSMFTDGYKKAVPPTTEEVELTVHLMKFAIEVNRNGIDLQTNTEAAAAADSIYQLFRRVMSSNEPPEEKTEDIVLSESTLDKEQ